MAESTPGAAVGADTISADAAIPLARFHAALRAFLHRSEQIARSAGLTPQRYMLLLMIKGAADGSETSTVTELSERLRLAQSSVTELVTRAELVELIERTPSADDRRVAHLRLTAKGERCFARCFADERERVGTLRELAALITDEE